MWRTRYTVAREKARLLVIRMCMCSVVFVTRFLRLSRLSRLLHESRREPTLSCLVHHVLRYSSSREGTAHWSEKSWKIDRRTKRRAGGDDRNGVAIPTLLASLAPSFFFYTSLYILSPSSSSFPSLFIFLPVYLPTFPSISSPLANPNSSLLSLYFSPSSPSL